MFMKFAMAVIAGAVAILLYCQFAEHCEHPWQYVRVWLYFVVAVDFSLHHEQWLSRSQVWNPRDEKAIPMRKVAKWFFAAVIGAFIFYDISRTFDWHRFL